MRPTLRRLQYIENYLWGRLSPPQTADWNTQRLLDAELDADTRAQQALYQGLYAAGRQQLRHELNSIHEQLYGPPGSTWATVPTRLSQLARRWLGRGSTHN